ncbi:MAG: T9SS type A sorting domain-containing protein [Chitinophagaceae bacterium]|nr:MAG: T9SS type A sorting domain-containing protein [Chitinophagaceae bacterium]
MFMNTRYAVNRFLKTARNRFLGLLAFTCSLASSTTAQGQGCPAATIAYSQESFCSNDGNEMVMLTGTPGGTFSSDPGLIVHPLTGTIKTSSSSSGTYTVHYTIPAGSGCSAVDATASVTILPRISVSPMPNIGACAGTTVNVGSFNAGQPGATFMWTNDNPSIGLPASGTGDISSFTGTNTTDAPNRANIAVYATYTTNGVSCTSKPMRFAITINPVPEVSPISDMTFCSGETTAPFTITGPTTGDGVRYIWTSSNPAIGMMKSGYDVIPSFTALNSTGVNQTATVTVTPYYNNGARCSGNSTTFTITVNPSPTGTATLSYDGSPYCPIGTVNPTFSGPSGGTFIANSNGLVLNANTGTINTSLSTPGNYTVYYIYNNANGCSFINTANVTINNASAAFSYASASYCTSTTGMLYPTITGITGGTFSAPAGLVIDPNTGAVDLANSTRGDYNVSYSVNTPNCGNVVVQTPLSIIETPKMAPSPNVAVCAGSSVPGITFSTTNEPGASFTWTNDNPAIGLAATGNGGIVAFTAMNNTNAPLDAFIRVVPRIVKNGVTCYGRPMVFRIRVFPAATVTPVGNQPVCTGSATNAINFTNSSGSNTGMTYQWTNNNTSIGLPASGTGNIGSFTATNAGTANILVTVTNSYGCSANPTGFAYMVNNCGNQPTGTGGSVTTSRTRPAAAPATDAIVADAVAVSPNPARSQVTVTYKGGTVTLRVLDLNGTPLKTIRGFNSSNTVNLSDLRPGNYVLQLVDERKNTVVQRNIIKL